MKFTTDKTKFLPSKPKPKFSILDVDPAILAMKKTLMEPEENWHPQEQIGEIQMEADELQRISKENPARTVRDYFARFLRSNKLAHLYRVTIRQTKFTGVWVLRAYYAPPITVKSPRRRTAPANGAATPLRQAR